MAAAPGKSEAQAQPWELKLTTAFQVYHERQTTGKSRFAAGEAHFCQQGPKDLVLWP